MKYFVLLLLFSGCATEIRDPKTGVVVFRTYGDSRQIAFNKSGNDYSLQTIDLNHSIPTRAAGSVVGTAGSAFAVSGIGAILKP